MSISKPPAHLFCQKTTYYFRTVIPKRHRPVLGKTEYRYSLKTSSLRVARNRANKLSGVVNSIFSWIDAMDNRAKELTATKIKELAEKWLRETLELGLTFMVSDRLDPNHPAEFGYAASPDVLLEDHTSPSERSISWAREQASRLLAFEGIEGHPGESYYELLCFELLRSVSLYSKINDNRRNGDFSDPYYLADTDPTPETTPGQYSPQPPIEDQPNLDVLLAEYMNRPGFTGDL